MSVHPAGFLLLYAVPLIFGFIVIALWINMIFLGLFWGKTKDVVRDAAQSKEGIQQAIANKKDNMGPWTIHSIFTLLLIIITAILLFTRLPLLWSGWDDHVPIVKCGASVPIILMSLFFFAVPANYMFCRYYCCRQPQKEGTAPALVGWKIVNANTPWSHLFMMGAGGAFLRGYKDSKLMDLVNQTIARQGYRSTSCAVLASLLGTLLTSIAPATFVANIVLGSMVPLVGNLALSLIISMNNLLHRAYKWALVSAGWPCHLQPLFIINSCCPSAPHPTHLSPAGAIFVHISL